MSDNAQTVNVADIQFIRLSKPGGVAMTVRLESLGDMVGEFDSSSTAGRQTLTALKTLRTALDEIRFVRDRVRVEILVPNES